MIELRTAPCAQVKQALQGEMSIMGESPSMWPTHAAAILDVRRDESRSDQRYIRVMATANEVKPGEHFIH